MSRLPSQRAERFAELEEEIEQLLVQSARPAYLITIMFLHPEIADQQQQLDQATADGIYVRHIESALRRLYRHYGTLVSKEAIKQGAQKAEDVWHELTGVVEARIENEPTPKNTRCDDSG